MAEVFDNWIGQFHKSHSATVQYPIIHHNGTEMGQLHCGMCEIGPINSHTQTQNYIWWFVSFTLNWNVMLTCSSLVAPQVVKHYCSQWWHFVKMTTFPFKCTAVSGYRIALNSKLRWSLSLKILKARAHLLAFKFFILEKFSCFIVLLFFFCYFPIIRTDSCVISWKMTFFLKISLVATSLRYMWAVLACDCRPLAG